MLDFSDYMIEPCPFCGTPLEPKYNLIISREDIDDHWYVRNWVVQCDTCGARGGKSRHKKQAIEKWNRRANDAN